MNTALSVSDVWTSCFGANYLRQFCMLGLVLERTQGKFLREGEAKSVAPKILFWRLCAFWRARNIWVNLWRHTKIFVSDKFFRYSSFLFVLKTQTGAVSPFNRLRHFWSKYYLRKTPCLIQNPPPHSHEIFHRNYIVGFLLMFSLPLTLITHQKFLCLILDNFHLVPIKENICMFALYSAGKWSTRKKL